MPREKWTDERLDEAFVRVDADIRELRSEMNARFDAMNGRFDAMKDSIDARFDAMKDSIDARFDAQNRNLMAGLFLVIATVIGSSVAL